jgi:hypothetical protein
LERLLWPRTDSLLLPCRAPQDITEFQKEKQGALNQIDVVVNLKMHQVRTAANACSTSHADSAFTCFSAPLHHLSAMHSAENFGMYRLMYCLMYCRWSTSWTGACPRT